MVTISYSDSKHKTTVLKIVNLAKLYTRKKSIVMVKMNLKKVMLILNK
jgi:hypothetical protein